MSIFNIKSDLNKWRREHVPALLLSCTHIAAVIILSGLVSGCSKTKILNEDKFMKVYVDLVIAQDTINVPAAKFDSVKTVVFKLNGITGEDYNATINYYNKDPQKWQKFFIKTTDYVDRLRRKNLPASNQIRK